MREPTLYRATDRGITVTDWLMSRHSFSFGTFNDPERICFGSLRVLNEDIVQPGQGFEPHSHKNMEILTIVLDGALEHKDSHGNHGVLRRGDVQRMTAGSGIEHSEFNASSKYPVHFLQIWIYPSERNLEPSYEVKTLASVENDLLCIASEGGGGGSLKLHQSATLYSGKLGQGKSLTYQVSLKKRGCYLFVIDGEVEVLGHTLSAGDALSTTSDDPFKIQGKCPADFLLFDVEVEFV